MPLPASRPRWLQCPDGRGAPHARTLLPRRETHLRLLVLSSARPGVFAPASPGETDPNGAAVPLPPGPCQLSSPVTSQQLSVTHAASLSEPSVTRAHLWPENGKRDVLKGSSSYAVNRALSSTARCHLGLLSLLCSCPDMGRHFAQPYRRSLPVSHLAAFSDVRSVTSEREAGGGGRGEERER